ncbi:MAG: energy transducer TonB [Acidobacteria bacterium]|nr:energy transducer TonB [Acidobacteriota bacterium]
MKFRRPLHACIGVALLFGAPMIAHAVASKSDLQAAYGNKILTLRQAYPGASLHFGADGKLSPPAAPGPWTVDGQVRVQDISLQAGVLHIKAQRLFLFLDPGSNQFRDLGSITKEDPSRKIFRIKKIDEWASKHGGIEIELECGTAQPEIPDVAKVMEVVFLAADEPLKNALPDVWKAWFASKDKQDKDNVPVAQDHSAPVVPVGGGVSPPQLKYDPEPEYSEFARQAGYAAQSILSVVVGTDGLAHDIRIMKPAGLGLDEQAIKAVETWRFDPATRDGHPVLVLISVQVNFKLY